MTPDRKSAIWEAVDRLTKPRRQRLERGEPEGWLTEIATAREGACDIAAYRSATTAWATIPSLWEQSTIALEGGEIQTAGRGSKPLRERSIADLDLMEIRALIRDTTRRELEKRAVTTRHQPNGRTVDFHPDEMRRLASHVTGDPTSDLDWWQYRFAQWARLLETYLHAAEHEARPVRLRNSPCPECGARQVTLDLEGDTIIVPAIVIDFRDGYIRAAECSRCGAAWFRGPDLYDLADQLGGTRHANIDAAC